MTSSGIRTSLLIKRAQVWTPAGFRELDLRIGDGKIEGIGRNLYALVSYRHISGEGLHILPGLCDLHVHFREPGYSYKETIGTGSSAAAHGGFTVVCTMPNLNPAPDSLETLRVQRDIIERDAVIDVLPFATITRQRLGNETVDYEALAPYVAGFSDDGSGVQDNAVMERAMEGVARTGKILAAHCEVNSLLKGGYIHDGEFAREHGHRGICSESEWSEVKRDIELAEKTGCRLHICHISTKESVDLVREGKRRGIPVTCETGPHYLTLCDEDLQEEGRFKMNPPLRSREDLEALIEGLRDGTIDAIATDHAPHSAEEKSKGLEKSAMGVTGLECSLPVVYSRLVREGVISLEKMVDVMAVNPRRILGLDTTFSIGDDADLILVDFRESFRINPDEFLSMGRSTPFEGMEVTGKVLLTIAEGRTVYENL